MSTNDTSREDWIDEDGDDCLPVFVTTHGEKYHKRDGGCTESRFADTHYDLFTADRDGYEPCHDCFHDDPYVGTTSQPPGDETTYERLNYQLGSEVLAGVAVTHADTRYTARVRRGGVQKYDERWVEVDRDGLSFRLRPADIDGVITTLQAIQTALVEDELHPPCCKYCGEAVASVEAAERHHADSHEGDDRLTGGDGFATAHYEPDPNGSIERLCRRVEQTEGGDGE